MSLSPQERKANYDAMKDFKLPGPEMRTMAANANMVTSAVKQVEKEAVDFSKDWVLDHDGMFILAETGETMAEVIERWRTERPHLWPAPPEPSILDEAERAFGAQPSLAERGAFLKKHGHEQFEYYREMFGADLRTLRPGKLPEAGNGETQPTRKASPSNPWSDNFPGGPNSDAALAQRASIMRGLGLKKATELAASAGKTVTGAPLKK